jgi:hypothetical protein
LCRYIPIEKINTIDGYVVSGNDWEGAGRNQPSAIRHRQTENDNSPPPEDPVETRRGLSKTDVVDYQRKKQGNKGESASFPEKATGKSFLLFWRA